MLQIELTCAHFLFPQGRENIHRLKMVELTDYFAQRSQLTKHCFHKAVKIFTVCKQLLNLNATFTGAEVCCCAVSPV